MLEKHQPASTTIWSVNNIWFAFLFICICWVAIMIPIIHREVINQGQLTELFQQQALLEIQLEPLRQTDAQSDEYEDLRQRLEAINSRITAVQNPPRALFVIFTTFEVLFIVGFYMLLWRIRNQVQSPLLRIYLATLPLGFIYFFVTMVHEFEHYVILTSNVTTLAVALHFGVGIVVLGFKAIWGNVRDNTPKPIEPRVIS